jgi:hypothetical protein
MPTKFGLHNGLSRTGSGGTSGSVPLCFGSMHTGIINFAMGDGSIRTIRPGNAGVRNPLPSGTPDWLVLQQMSGAEDGEVYNSSQLGN